MAINPRTGLAVARTLLPGSHTIPPPDAALVRDAEAWLESAAPVLGSAWRWLHSAIDAAALASTGKHFADLNDAARTRLVTRLESNVATGRAMQLVSMVYKVHHFDAAHVQTAMGARQRTVVRSLEKPRWIEQVHRAADWDDGDIECDAVVIGTGAGGALAGRHLAERGHAVVFVERGEHLRRDVFDGSAVRAHSRFLRTHFAVGEAIIPVFSGDMVGGSTAVNGGTCFRTPQWILDRWCEDLGTDEFAPERMEAFQARVERSLGVEPSLQREVGPIRDVLARGCDELGWSHFPIRRNAHGCKGSGFCHFGCPSDARRSTNLSAIPDALQHGAMLLSEATASQIIVEHGRASGLMVTDRNGRTIRIRARAVILAAGALATPTMLVAHGLGERSGELGKNLTLHPSCGVSGLMDEPINGHHFIPQGYGCDEFVRDGELILAAQPDTNVAAVLFPMSGRPLMEALDNLPRLAGLGVMIRDGDSKGRIWRTIKGQPVITYRFGERDKQRLHSVMTHAMQMLVAAGARRLYPSVSSSPIVDDIATYRAPRLGDYSLVSYHPLGTVRMGKDPRTSVVSLDHEMHDVKRLYVVDGSTVPSALGVNPQITIMSMALRAAERIDDALGRATQTPAVAAAQALAS